jgi:serine protease DegQ
VDPRFVSFGFVVDPGDDFDDIADDEPPGPLLPPDDRVWRHPSELTARRPPIEQETLLAQRRWMQSTPTRSGARAAGIAGAVLAAGVVLVGTHLNSWLVRDPAPGTGSNAMLVTATTRSTPASSPAIAMAGLSPLLVRASDAIVRVVSSAGSRPQVESADAVIVSSDGYILAPEEAIENATSVSVVRSDGEQLPARVTGVDPDTGLAMLRVDETGLPTLSFQGAVISGENGAFLVDLWREAAPQYFLVHESRPPKPAGIDGGPAVLEQGPASLGLDRLGLGGVVIDGSGQVTEMVTEHTGGTALAVPGAIASEVANQLIEHGRVEHGWLGILGATVTVPEPETLASQRHQVGVEAPRAASLRGVEVTSTMADGAAERAGIRPGDVIAEIDGHPVASMAALQADLYVLPPLTSVKIDLVRDGVFHQINARLLAAA